MTIKDLDSLIRSALAEFAADLSSRKWHGRENELVNLFAFGHLLRLGCPPQGNLDPTQIGIEVAVPQLEDWGENQKDNVRKDLVIWRTAGATCWSEPFDPPLAILEWKSLSNVSVKERPKKKRKEFASDLDWLVRTTLRLTPLGFDKMIAYGIFVDLALPSLKIDCHMIRNGQMESWSLL